MHASLLEPLYERRYPGWTLESIYRRSYVFSEMVDLRIGGVDLIEVFPNEVGADADVVYPDHVDDMEQVVDDAVYRRAFGIDEGRDGGRDPDDSAERGDGLDVLVDQVAVMIAQTSRRGVGGDERPGRVLQNVFGALHREMRDVHDDPEAFEHAKSIDAVRRQALARIAIRASSGKQRVTEMRERGHPQSQIEERLEELDVAGDPMAAFQRQYESQPAFGYRGVYLGSAEAKGYFALCGGNLFFQVVDKKKRATKRAFGNEL